MNRRAFFTLTLGLVATPLGAEGQPAGKVYRVGWLGSTNPIVGAPFLAAFGARTSSSSIERRTGTESAFLASHVSWQTATLMCSLWVSIDRRWLHSRQLRRSHRDGGGRGSG
jgi:hypothetical protein